MPLGMAVAHVAQCHWQWGCPTSAEWFSATLTLPSLNPLYRVLPAWLAVGPTQWVGMYLESHAHFQLNYSVQSFQSGIQLYFRTHAAEIRTHTLYHTISPSQELIYLIYMSHVTWCCAACGPHGAVTVSRHLIMMMAWVALALALQCHELLVCFLFALYMLLSSARVRVLHYSVAGSLIWVDYHTYHSIWDNDLWVRNLQWWGQGVNTNLHLGPNI